MVVTVAEVPAEEPGGVSSLTTEGATVPGDEPSTGLAASAVVASSGDTLDSVEVMVTVVGPAESVDPAHP